MGERLRELDPKTSLRVERFLEDLTEHLRETMGEEEFDRLLSRVVRAEIDLDGLVEVVELEEKVRRRVSGLRREADRIRTELKRSKSKIDSRAEELEEELERIEEELEDTVQGFVEQAVKKLSKILEGVGEEDLRRFVKGRINP